MEPNSTNDGPHRTEARSRGADSHGSTARDGPVPVSPALRSPGDYPRRVLLCVTGLSPQVVTETLYALAVRSHPVWVPTEIRLVTTARGAENARLKLLSDDPGWYRRLCTDYELSGIRFSAEHIHVIEYPDGRAEDIRDDTDNRRAADFITSIVRRLTRDDEAAVHASIAGGRKTMGFYLGYAMSLYGRTQDRLSHVLVSAPFESHPEFFYPTPDTRVIETLDRTQQALDTSTAHVWLGNIPYVRLRDGLDRDLLEGETSFSDLVADAQRAVPPIMLVLDPARRAVTAGGETFSLSRAEFAFYWMLAERLLEGAPGVHWTDDDIGRAILEYYGRVAGAASGDYEELEQSFRLGVTASYFDPRKSNTNKAIGNALGRRRAKPYLIARTEKIPGTRYWRSGLLLPPDAITIIRSPGCGSGSPKNFLTGSVRDPVNS